MKSIIYGVMAAASICLLPVVSQVVETPVPGDPVAIESGAVSGKVLPSGVKAYFGIPFAAPPTGDFRWREPQPVKAWKGVYHADRKMQECIQVLRPHNINHYFGEEATGEDCLYLNVWAPGSARAGANLPVIVYIYGGGSTIGSSGMAIYGGESVAARGAVFVNFNYRLGALGFMAHPALTAASPHHQSGNYAYLDQVAALQWIQRNIAKFGGDPHKVVISGQSAGAGAVSLLQASPMAKGLFRGVVAMSGGAWGNNGRATSLADAEKIGVQVQEALKAKTIDDLRYVPADRILALQEEFQVGARGGSIRVGGANVDGYFLPKSPAELFAAHMHNDVTAVVGFTHDESSNALRLAKNVDAYKAAAGIDMRKGLEQQRLAVASGIWPMFRYNPALADEGKNPLLIDSKDPSVPVQEYAYNETRYRMLMQSDEARAELLMNNAREDVRKRWDFYKQMAAMHYNSEDKKE